MQNSPGVGLAAKVGTGLVKVTVGLDKLPPVAKVAARAVVVGGVVLDAAQGAEKLMKRVQQALDEGQPPVEAHVCPAANVVAEKVVGAVAKSAVAGGVVPYLVAATTNPVLAATIPAILPLISPAYQGAQTLAATAGNAAEAACYGGFDLAKQLAGKK
jgi:hypothetical protein